MKIVLDCNIDDILAQDIECLTLLTSIPQKEDWEVMIPITLLDELKTAHLRGFKNELRQKSITILLQYIDI